MFTFTFWNISAKLWEKNTGLMLCYKNMFGKAGWAENREEAFSSMRRMDRMAINLEHRKVACTAR